MTEPTKKKIAIIGNTNVKGTAAELQKALMNNPTNEQLQERCLEFAGIEILPKGSHDKFHQLNAYKYPDGNTYSVQPPFLTSVDAHVKWTLPKLYWWDLFGFKGGGCAVLVQYKKSSPIINHHTETPALAICKAIWELTEKDDD